MSELIQRRKYEVKGKILKYLRMGSTRKAASEAAGVSYETLRVWMNENSAFSALVRQAESECEALMSASIARAAYNGDWRAAIAWLQVRRRQVWGKQLEVSELTDEQIISILESEDREGSEEEETPPAVSVEADTVDAVPGSSDIGASLAS